MSYDNEVLSFEHNGKTVKIYQDTDPMNPREGYDLGIMVCEHRDYYLGDEPERGKQSIIEEYADLKRAMLHYGRDVGNLALFDRYCRIYHGTTVILPLYLLDHSGLAMRTSTFMEDPGGWDTSMVGFILDTAKTRETTGVKPENVEEGLRAEVKVYGQYLEGDVYGYVVEDADGEDEDSCWGFFGYEYAQQAARDAAGYTCKHCGHDIHRWYGGGGDVIDTFEKGDWVHSHVCTVCGRYVAWGGDGHYHVDMKPWDWPGGKPDHTADSGLRHACADGEHVAETDQEEDRRHA